jgi:uncharacterized protein YggE
MAPSARVARPLALVAALALAAGVAAQDTKCCGGPRTLRSKGIAYAEVAQNFTLVKLSVGAEGQRVFDVQNSITYNTKAVLDFLEAKKEVMNVQSTGTNLYPQYGYDSSNGYKRYFEKYTANAEVSFELTTLSSDVLDGVLKVGGATVQNISKKEKYEDLVAAQREAVKNAVYGTRANAEKMVEGLGEKLGKPLYVESYANDYLQSGGGSLQVIRAEATVTYEIVG